MNWFEKEFKFVLNPSQFLNEPINPVISIWKGKSIQMCPALVWRFPIAFSVFFFVFFSYFFNSLTTNKAQKSIVDDPNNIRFL